MMAGVLLHGGYLGGVWWAVAQGLPAGISGLITAAQPLLTALLAAPLLGERVTRRQWCGIVGGFVGIVLVLAPRLVAVDMAALGIVALPMIVNFAATVSVTLGTFYQKRFVASADLRTGTLPAIHRCARRRGAACTCHRNAALRSDRDLARLARLVGAGDVDGGDCAAAADDPTRRSLAGRGADLSGAAAHRARGVHFVRGEPERRADRSAWP